MGLHGDVVKMAECKILSINEVTQMDGTQPVNYVKVKYYCAEIDYMGTLLVVKKDFSAAKVKELIAAEVEQVQELKAMGT